MLYTQNLEKLLALTLYSAYIKNEKAVNLLLIANPEAGKTELLKKFYQNKGVAVLTDVTAYSISRDLLHKIQNKEIRHIIIPDLIKVLSRKTSTVQNLITFLNSLIEEGIISIKTYAMNIEFQNPVNCGLITSITQEIFEDKRRNWGKIGFLSRCLPVSWSYTKEQVLEIYDYIYSEKYMHENVYVLKLPKTEKEIKIDKDYAKMLTPYVKELADSYKMYGFRYQKQFQVLAKANALMNKRDEVTEKDIIELQKILKFTNIKFNPLE